jgi:hypothetical protein
MNLKFYPEIKKKKIIKKKQKKKVVEVAKGGGRPPQELAFEGGRTTPIAWGYFGHP